MKEYDYIIVGAGLFGLTFARLATDWGKKCLVIDKRDKIGGNCSTKYEDGIEIHEYGPHIFHTNNEDVWKFANRFTKFNNYINRPLANYKGKIFNLPFNMNTFSKIFNVTTPKEAKEAIKLEVGAALLPNSPLKMDGLEGKAIQMVGITIYKMLIKEYTEKQWGKKCTELSPDIIKRIPLRFTYDNNYFTDKYQGVPTNGYDKFFERLAEGIEIRTGITDFLANKSKYKDLADTIIYTGPIDEYFDYSLGTLEWRSVMWDNHRFEESNVQGNAVINYTSHDHAYTRAIEYKHFRDLTEEEVNKNPVSWIGYEYSVRWEKGEREPFYPINNELNTQLYKRYQELSKKEKNVYFGGRLGTYSYLNMDQVIAKAMDLFKEIN